MKKKKNNHIEYTNLFEKGSTVLYRKKSETWEKGDEFRISTRESTRTVRSEGFGYIYIIYI